MAAQALQPAAALAQAVSAEIVLLRASFASRSQLSAT